MLVPSAMRREVFASRMNRGLHPTKNQDLHMDGSFNELIKFQIWPFPETAMGVLCNCLVDA